MPFSNSTLRYYADHSNTFLQATIDADMSESRDRFLAYLPAGAHILDFRCAPGGMRKHFWKSVIRWMPWMDRRGCAGWPGRSLGFLCGRCSFRNWMRRISMTGSGHALPSCICPKRTCRMSCTGSQPHWSRAGSFTHHSNMEILKGFAAAGTSRILRRNP